VWYSPAVSRWIAERQPVTAGGDGSCLARQPYVDEHWLTRYLLRFAGEARPLEPPEAVDDLRATLSRLLAVYGRG
jgi:predicted DNA-binding transcriptional regulator YafY